MEMWRNAIVGWELQPEGERTRLRGVALEHGDLRPRWKRWWSVAPHDLARVEVRGGRTRRLRGRDRAGSFLPLRHHHLRQLRDGPFTRVHVDDGLPLTVNLLPDNEIVAAILEASTWHSARHPVRP